MSYNYAKMFHLVATKIFGAGVDCGLKSFFGLPSLYEYIPPHVNAVGVCEPAINFYNAQGNLDLTVVSLVLLAVIDILLRVGTLVAVGFMIYAGVQYLTAQGEPDKAKRALGTIISSSIGLGITLVAAASVSFIGHRVGGAAAAQLGLPQVTADQGSLKVLLDTFFSVMAAAALLVLAIAGLRYVNSNGDPTTMSKAKNTIIYSAIGLVVAMSGFAMVTFLLNNL